MVDQLLLAIFNTIWTTKPTERFSPLLLQQAELTALEQFNRQQGKCQPWLTLSQGKLLLYGCSIIEMS